MRSMSGARAQGCRDGTRRYLVCDFDAYFCACEAMDRGWTGVPVAVSTDRVVRSSSTLIAVDYLCRAAGVSKGANAGEVRRQVPGVRVVAQRPLRYAQIHREVLGVVDRVRPLGGVRSIDDFWFRLDAGEDPDAAMEALGASLGNAFGPALALSMAVAPSVWAGKVAAVRHKPKARVVWRASDLPQIAFGLRLRDLDGIAGAVERRLGRHGIDSVEALACAAPARVRVAWGSVEGLRVQDWLCGGDTPCPVPVRHSFVHGKVLAPEERTPAQALRVARVLVLRLASRARRAGALPMRVGVGVASGARAPCDRWASVALDEPPGDLACARALVKAVHPRARGGGERSTTTESRGFETEYPRARGTWRCVHGDFSTLLHREDRHVPPLVGGWPNDPQCSPGVPASCFLPPRAGCQPTCRA